MNKPTILALNQLNRDFYQQVAQDFSDTRQQPWAGWTRLQPVLTSLFQPDLNSEARQVLDVGCGNGRWLSFLHEHVPAAPVEYLGVDMNTELLALAIQQTSELGTSATFREQDVVAQLVAGTPIVAATTHFDLITLFGVMHHVPSFELRQKMITELAAALKPSGYLIFTNWLFLDSPKLKQRCIPASLVGLNSHDLETDDYILDWQRGTTAYRYCHYVNEVEVASLIKESGLELVEMYRADGKDNQLNRYVVLRKSAI